MTKHNAVSLIPASLALVGLVAACVNAARVSGKDWNIRMAAYFAVLNLLLLVPALYLPPPRNHFFLSLNPAYAFADQFFGPIRKFVPGPPPGLLFDAAMTFGRLGMSTALWAVVGFGLGRKIDRLHYPDA